ncbi:UNVERIFIED_CONTAM: hypothetical protein GTU68_034517 [Idotea baltica]|nr:hypothetical protein [Idotea baltica]
MGEDQVWKRRRRRVRRAHGLQFPLHPQQVLAWVVMVAFVALTFGTIVPALHSSLVLPVAITSGLLFTAHVITHFLALVVDPADPQLRAQKRKQQIPEFDRNVHSHVIENGRCHLCNITITSQRTKHCSACNKCVDVFDHHCKWLNHCIGKRNYLIFIACLATAILSCFLIMGFCIAEIVLYYFDREHLAPWEKGRQKTYAVQQSNKEPEEETTITCTVGSPYCHFTVFGASVYDGAFIGILSTLFSIALVAEVLLIHLAAFHAYINYLNLTTYEYIRGNNVRDTTSAFSFNAYAREENMDPEGAVCGWTVSKRSSNNQITPSSTTDTALLSTPSYDSSIGSRSPRSSSTTASPSTPSDSQFNFSTRHHGQHNQNTSSPKITPRTSSNSSVPSLPHILKPSTSRPRANLRSANRNLPSSQDLDLENEIEVRLVSIPRPRPSRRRLRSSVAPHLSPIKECDLASSSPPSLRAVHSDVGEKNGSLTNSPSRPTNLVDSPVRKNRSYITKGIGQASIENESPGHSVPKLQTSPKTSNTFLKGSPLKSPSHSPQVYPEQSPSFPKNICSNPPSKIFVVNDFKYSSPIRVNSVNSKSCISPSRPIGNARSPLKSISPLPNSPRLVAHIKGKNVAITIVNEIDRGNRSPALQNGRILSKDRKSKLRSDIKDESKSGTSVSNGNNVRGLSNHTNLTEHSDSGLHSKSSKPTPNGSAHVELHM